MKPCVRLVMSMSKVLLGEEDIFHALHTCLCYPFVDNMKLRYLIVTGRLRRVAECHLGNGIAHLRHVIHTHRYIYLYRFY